MPDEQPTAATNETVPDDVNPTPKEFARALAGADAATNETDARPVVVGPDAAEWVVMPSLPVLLGAAVEADRLDPPNYEARNHLIRMAIGAAAAAGVPVGIRLDPNEPEWPVVYFELPSGQVSWHLPQHEREWDGHSTPEKIGRVMNFTYLAGRRG